MYTVVDIETTGTGATGNRITEIALYNVDQGQVTDSFVSLVNPGCEIPAFITGLTGITTAMVRNAPPFEALADQIDAFCKGRVFVAHSVNFDYPIVKREFEACGRNFSRKKLCTVRLSRSVFPGLRSYSLGKLCNTLEIPLKDRHRAAGDAHATALLLGRVLAHPKGPDTISRFLNARSQEATLPPQLPKDTFANIPEAPGVYYFRDQQGKLLYVGKAINLKKRVLGHFYDTSERERSLCRETAHIDVERSGSDLLALLMESAAIKTHFPPFNRAQKSVRPAFGLLSYTDQAGIRHLAVSRIRKGQQAHKVFFALADARLFLEACCMQFGLCAKYCHLQEGVETCGHFRVPKCGGVCRGAESAEAYNQKVRTAIESMRTEDQHVLIGEAGREPGERAVVWISGGVYKGYGFIPEETGIQHPEDLEPFIEPQRHNSDTHRILESYMLKNPGKIRRIGVKGEA